MIRDQHAEHYIMRARELRAQALANLARVAWVELQRLPLTVAINLKKLVNWFRSAQERERDAFLSHAADHADLERRIRIFENRRHHLLFNYDRYDLQ